MTTPALHPLMREMFAMLPAAGAEWPVERRLEWLRALAAVAVVVYGPLDDGEIVVTTPPQDPPA